MSWVATAIVGGSVITGYLGNKSANAASDASSAATAATIEEQRRQFDLTRQDTEPYRQAGVNALNYLSENIGDTGAPPPAYTPFTYSPTDYANSPEYQFRFNQGTEAVNRGTAKSGNLNSGNRLLALQNFGQGLAAQGYAEDYDRQMKNHLTNYGMNYQENQDIYGRNQNVLNRYAAMAGVGQTGVAQSGAAGQNSANAISGALGANAANQSTAAALRYGSLNNAIQGGIGNYMTYNYLNPSSRAYPPINYNTISYDDINSIYPG
jgi:hypothetical protein